ncbi:MAG: substrate-binding domain-containing protein, partial [Pseudomonadota bacterium]
TPRPTLPVSLTGSQAKISLVIPPAQGREHMGDDPFFSALIGGITAAARASQCDVMLNHSVPRDVGDLQNIMSGLGVDGALFLGQSDLHEGLNAVASQGHRFVVWGAELPGQLYCCVGSYNVRGGRRATEHLLRLGRKNIVFLGDTDEPEIRQRFDGYRYALDDAGVLYRGDLVFTVPFEIESSQSTLDQLLSQGVDFDGVFAASDLAAIGAIRALQRAGRRVPEDVSVIGYDDLALGRYVTPTLSTIRQDLQAAGRLMVAKLLSAHDTREALSERLEPELIVRESCGS